MGIKEKGFADWVATEFPGVVRPLAHNETSNFDTVCIDINPLLHTCLRNASDESRFVKALFNDLDRCLRLTCPRKTVYLAVDGAAPLAKMKEQIRRRKSRSPSKNKKMDSSQITPGCTFMFRVTEYLHYYAARYLARKKHDRFLRFIVDGAETYGEGEAKIMKYLYSDDGRTNGPIAIFSGDSDVIIQSLLSPASSIYVLRPGVADVCFFAVSISALKQAIHTVTIPKASVIKDFCVLVMFSGNDYVRKLRGGRMSKIWPVYKRLVKDLGQWQGRQLINPDNTFDYEVLYELLTRIRKLTIRAVFKPDLSISLAMLGLSEQTASHVELDDDEEDEDDLDARDVKAEERAATYTKHIPNYLESLLWTLNMYATGQCSDFNFSQIGLYLTPEQLLTFMARDLVATAPIRIPANPESKPLITTLCAVTLLKVEKASLIPLSWRQCFANETVRTQTQKMIHESSLIDECLRIQTILWKIGQIVIQLIDQNSPLVQALTFSQSPVVLSHTTSKPYNAARIRPLGTSHEEIWSDVTLSLPVLEPDSLLFIRAYTGKGSKASKYSEHTSAEWPFRARLVKNNPPMRKIMSTRASDV